MPAAPTREKVGVAMVRTHVRFTTLSAGAPPRQAKSVVTQWTCCRSALARAFAIPDGETPSARAVSARARPSAVTRWTANAERTAAMRPQTGHERLAAPVVLDKHGPRGPRRITCWSVPVNDPRRRAGPEVPDGVQKRIEAGLARHRRSPPQAARGGADRHYFTELTTPLIIPSLPNPAAGGPTCGRADSAGSDGEALAAPEFRLEV